MHNSSESTIKIVSCIMATLTMAYVSQAPFVLYQQLSFV